MDGSSSGCHPRSVWRSGKAATTSLVRDFATFLHEDDCGQFSEQLEVVRETGATVTMEARFRTWAGFIAGSRFRLVRGGVRH